MSDSHSYQSRDQNDKNSDNRSVWFNWLYNRKQSPSENHFRFRAKWPERLRKLSKSRHPTDRNPSNRHAIIPLRHADPGKLSGMMANYGISDTG